MKDLIAVLVDYALIFQFELSDVWGINTSSQGSTIEEAPRVPQVVLLNHQYKSSEDGPASIVGHVKNIGNETAGSVQVFVATHDKNGEIIEENLINSTVGDLKVGQKSSFNLTASKEKFDEFYDYDMSIQWLDLEGQEQRIDGAKTYLEE